MHPVNEVEAALQQNPTTIQELISALSWTGYRTLPTSEPDVAEDVAAATRLIVDGFGEGGTLVDDGIRPPYVEVFFSSEWWVVMGRLQFKSPAPPYGRVIERIASDSPVVLITRGPDLISHGPEVVQLATRAWAHDLADRAARALRPD